MISVVQNLFILGVGLAFYAQRDLNSSSSKQSLNVFDVNKSVSPNLKAQLVFSGFLIVFYLVAIYISL